MDKNSNIYTVGFATVMTVIVAILLAFLATSLMPMQKANQKLANKTDILKAIGLSDLPKDSVTILFDERVTSIILDKDGNEKTDGGDALEINIGKESKLTAEQRRYPIYVYKDANMVRYIVPMYGNGLWDKIWGYLALEPDANTVAGISFDHKAETPGLGAEIKDNPEDYNDPYVGKRIYDVEGNFVSIDMIKGALSNPDHQINAITGATLTSDGVNDMMRTALLEYMPYLEKVRN